MTTTHSLETILAESAWVRSLARSLTRTEADAEDLMQDAWTAAIRRPPDADRPVRPWLATVLRNLARSKQRSAARLRARESEVSRQEAKVPSADELVSIAEQQEQLSALVRQLDPTLWEALLLRYQAGLSGAEIARRLNVPAGTVRWRLKRGLESLKEQLDRRHDGDRSLWMTVLAPMVRLESNGVVSVASSGGVAFGGGAWLLAAAALVLGSATMFVLPSLLNSSETVLGTTPSSPSQAVLASVSDPRPEPAPAPESRALVPSENETVANLASEPTPSPLTTLSLRVVDPNGNALAGVSAELKGGLGAWSALRESLEAGNPIPLQSALEDLRATSNASGLVEFSSRLLLEPAVLVLRLHGPHNGFKERQIDAVPGASIDLGDIVLEPMALVSGRLFDLSGVPVRGELRLLAAEGEEEVLRHWFTSDDGEFELRFNYAGPVRLKAQAVYGDDPWIGEPFVLKPGESLDRDIEVKTVPSSIRVAAVNERSEPIDMHFGLMLRAGELNLGTQEGLAPAGEAFEFRGYLARASELRVRAAAAEGIYAPVEFVQKPPFEDITVRFKARPSRSIRVVVRGIESGNAVPIRVTREVYGADCTWMEQQTEFTVELPTDAAATPSLRFEAEGYVKAEVQSAECLAVKSPLEVQLQPPAGIRGFVHSQGVPVADAELRISHRRDEGEWRRRYNAIEGVRWRSGHEGRGDEEGRFHVPLAFEGDWVMEVSAEGFAPALVELDGFRPGEGRDGIVVELVPPSEVVGRVLDEFQAPVANAKVVALHALHRARFTRSGGDGSYRLGGLAPGEWFIFHPAQDELSRNMSLTLSAPADWRIPPGLQLRSGGSQRLDLHPPATTEVEFKVRMTGALDVPAKNSKLTVTLEHEDPLLEYGPIEAVLDEDGAARVALPPDRGLDLRAWVPELEGSLRLPGPWKANDLNYSTIEIPTGALEAIGQPGASHRIRVRLPGGGSFYAQCKLGDTGVSGPLILPVGFLERRQGDGSWDPLFDLDLGSTRTLDLR